MDLQYIIADGKFGYLVSKHDGKNICIGQNTNSLYSDATEEQIDMYFGEEYVKAKKFLQGIEEVLFTIEITEKFIVTPDGKIGTFESKYNNVYIRTKDKVQHLIYSPATEEQIDSFFGEEYVKAKKNYENIQKEISNCNSIIHHLNTFHGHLKNHNSHLNTDIYRVIVLGEGWQSKTIYVYDRIDNTTYRGITMFGIIMEIPIKDCKRFDYNYHDIKNFIPELERSIKKWEDKHDDLAMTVKEKATFYLSTLISEKFN